MFAELTADESTALVFLIMTMVLALAFLVVVGVDSALSSPVFRRRWAWLKLRESRRLPEHSEQFRTVAEWKVRSKDLRRKRG
jgi:hypothetical protein